MIHNAEGITVSVVSELATDEADRAKEFWSTTQAMGKAYSASAPPAYAQAVASAVMAAAPQSVLEFGCNAGRNLRLLSSQVPAGCRLTGIDINEQSVNYGIENYGLDLRIADESFLQQASDDAWDVVFTLSVLDHIPDVKQILRHLVRVAKRRLVLYEPVMSGANGRIETVNTPHGGAPVAEYSYFHDYHSLMQEWGAELLLDESLPPNVANIGPFYRLMVFTKGRKGA